MERGLISTEDVKRYFLLANKGKGLFVNPPNSKDLEEAYKRTFDEIFSLSTEGLNELITDKTRLARYDSFNWSYGLVSLGDIGPWPKMSSLDVRLTTGNILDTSEDIRKVECGELALPYTDIGEKEKRTNAFKRFLEKSRSIRDKLDFVYERFPIVLFPGGEVRENDYNVWARENNSPLCKIFGHDLDDGNNR